VLQRHECQIVHGILEPFFVRRSISSTSPRYGLLRPVGRHRCLLRPAEREH